MNNRRGILAGGNWILDRVKIIDVYPAQDALANILAESTCNGGSPYNLLKDLRQLGAEIPLEAVGLLGNDGAGRQILEDCEASRIDARQLHVTHEAPTSYTDVMTVRGTGRRTFFHNRGANALLGREHFDLAASQARILHLGYLLLLDRLDAPGEIAATQAAELLADASAAGFLTSVDVVSEDSARFAPIVLAALPHVDFCFMNEFEAERTTGVELRHAAGHLHTLHLARAADALLQAGTRRAVLLHCPEGAYARDKDGHEFWQGSVRVAAEEIVGTVGAGDAFTAGALHALHEDADLAAALELGVCAAATCLTHASTSAGLRPAAECLAYGRARGFRAFPTGQAA